MVILTLNCGSSSVKYQLYDWDQQLGLARGGVERVVVSGSFIRHFARGRDEFRVEQECSTHTEAIDLIIKTIYLAESRPLDYTTSEEDEDSIPELYTYVCQIFFFSVLFLGFDLFVSKIEFFLVDCRNSKLYRFDKDGNQEEDTH